MDAIVKKETRFLPALAEAIAEWFPELGGRSLAVSEVTVNKENIPTLPLAMVAYVRGTGEQSTSSNQSIFNMEDAFVVEFWLEPARYKRANGSETPFWSYYDYETIRDTLLENMARWDAPHGERPAYRGLNIEADQLAVTLTFAFVAAMRWCASPASKKPESIVSGVKFNLCTDQSVCVPDCFEEPEDECHPCK
jgi:hypothetical protein